VSKQVGYFIVGGLAVLSFVASVPMRDVAHAEAHNLQSFEPPVVFQAAGPSIVSIQGTLDAYRAALGGVNNGNAPGPLAGGRREINWDGGGSTATAVAATPFAGFLITRGALFTTNGHGFVQAPTSGLASTFGNASYETIFQSFSPVRLFSPIGSNVTEVAFFLPGGGNIHATTTGFGAVFSDVDQPDGQAPRRRGATLVEYYDAGGHLLYSSSFAASPGDASFSFLGILFSDARIAGVRIITGDHAPGGDDSRANDVVMMDDFIFGEPQAVN
jgi:hypothetical protein